MLRPFKTTLKYHGARPVCDRPDRLGQRAPPWQCSAEFHPIRAISILSRSKTRSSYEVPTLNQVMVNDKGRAGFPGCVAFHVAPGSRIPSWWAKSATPKLRALPPGGVDRPSGVDHAAHQRRDSGHHAPAGNGRGTPFIVAPAIIGVLAQRLVKVMQILQDQYRPDPAEFAPVFLLARRHSSCRCFTRARLRALPSGTGYTGRIGIHEFLNLYADARAIMRERNMTRS